MTALIGFEESQAVCKSFREQGHDAYSCDLKFCSGGKPEWHIRGDVFHELSRRLHVYDFLGMHPVCKYLANSGVKWLSRKKPTPGFEWNEKYGIYINEERFKLMQEAAELFKASLECVKAVGVGYVENPILHKYAMEIIGRQTIRSKTFSGIAKSMAEQWGGYVSEQLKKKSA